MNKKQSANQKADRKTIDSVKETIHRIDFYKDLGFDMSGCWYTCPVRLYDKIMEELKNEIIR